MSVSLDGGEHGVRMIVPMIVTAVPDKDNVSMVS